jgi:hypothetical protein
VASAVTSSAPTIKPGTRQ